MFFALEAGERCGLAEQPRLESLVQVSAGGRQNQMLDAAVAGVDLAFGEPAGASRRSVMPVTLRDHSPVEPPAGAIAGLAGAVAAEMTAGLIGRSFSEVTPMAIGVAAMLPNLFGGVFYSQVAARTPQPWLIYAGAAVLFGMVYTLLVGVQPPHADFMRLIVPMHAVVFGTCL